MLEKQAVEGKFSYGLDGGFGFGSRTLDGQHLWVSMREVALLQG